MVSVVYSYGSTFLAEIFLAGTGQRELCAGMVMNEGGCTARFLAEIFPDCTDGR